MYRNNVASQAVFCQMNSRTDGSPLTSSVTVTVTTGESGSQGASSGTLTHMGGGQWRYVPTQSEMNGAVVAVQFNHASGVNQTFTLTTTAANPLSATRGLSGTALPDAAAEAAGGLFTRGTGPGQINQDANGRIDVNMAAISEDATAANNAESFFDGTGYPGTNNVIPTVTTLTGHTAQTGDAFARLGAPAGASVSADIAQILAESATVAELADAVCDEALAGHTTAGTVGERLGRIPNAAAGGSGGLPTVDASNRIAGIQGTITTLDGLDTAQDTQHAATQATLASGVVVSALNDKTGMRLGALGVDDILDEPVVGTITLRQILRGLAASLVGKVSGAATTSITFRSADDTKDVIVATVDADGNRSAITLDLT